MVTVVSVSLELRKMTEGRRLGVRLRETFEEDDKNLQKARRSVRRPRETRRGSTSSVGRT